MKRTKDLRLILIEDAKQLFTRLAKLVARQKLLKARAKSKIATINDELEQALAPLTETAAGMEKDLTTFIEGNRGLFDRPRKVKCEGGSFGLQAAKGIVIKDEAALMEHLLECGYNDCYEIKRTPVKAVIEERLKAGCSLPGVVLAKGDTVVMKFAIPTDTDAG
ncbi:MAG: host-nuclease inhibitor Gam family protein [Kiritimatiellales bacterium]